jgi:hypothetical protein
MEFFRMACRIVPFLEPQSGTMKQRTENKAKATPMNKLYKAALVAILGLTGAATANASTGYDLILGVTQTGANVTGNDYFLDLGSVVSYPGASILTYGETWNLNADLTAQGFNLNQVQWGVFGNANHADGATTQLTWITTPGNTPNKINGGSGFDVINTPINSMLQSGFGVNGQTTFTLHGQTGTTLASGDNSWNGETIVAPYGTSLFNVLGMTPNVTGTGVPETLWQTPDNNSSPSALGYFSLDNGGILHYDVAPVPEPGTVSLIGAGALLLLALGKKFPPQQS